MLDFITLNISSKLTTSIHKDVFIDIVNSVQEKIENIRIIKNKTDINIVHSGKNIIISLDIKVKKYSDLGYKLNEIKEKIETHCQFLIDQKPIDIIINYVGNY